MMVPKKKGFSRNQFRVVSFPSISNYPFLFLFILNHLHLPNAAVPDYPILSTYFRLSQTFPSQTIHLSQNIPIYAKLFLFNQINLFPQLSLSIPFIPNYPSLSPPIIFYPTQTVPLYSELYSLRLVKVTLFQKRNICPSQGDPGAPYFSDLTYLNPKFLLFW